MAARLCVTEPLIPRGGRFAATEEPELLAEDPHMVPVVRKQRVLRRYGAAKLTLATDGLGSIAPFRQSVLSGLPRGIIGSQIHLHRILIIRRQFFPLRVIRHDQTHSVLAFHSAKDLREPLR